MKRCDAKIERMSRVPLFSRCTRDELSFISSRTSPHIAHAGDVLMHEGSSARQFFVVTEGSASMRICNRHLGMLSSGDCFGEMGLLDGGTCHTTVIADTDPHFTSLLLGMIRTSTRSFREDLRARAARAEIRPDLDIELAISILLGVVVAEVIRDRRTDEAWVESVLGLLWPSFEPR